MESPTYTGLHQTRSPDRNGCGKLGMHWPAPAPLPLALDLALLLRVQEVRMRLTVDPVSGHVSVLLEPTTPGCTTRPSSPTAGQPGPALPCHCRLLVTLLLSCAGLPNKLMS